MDVVVDDCNILEIIQELHSLHDEVSFLQAQKAALESENAALKTQNASYQDIKKSSDTFMGSCKMMAEGLDYAKQNTLLTRRVSQLEKSLQESKMQAAAERSEHELKEYQLRLECSSAQKEIEFLKVGTNEGQNNLQLITTGQSNIESQYDMEFVSMLEENYHQQLEMMRIALVEKQEALLTSKKDNTNMRQAYDLKIQELRMKYEEQLLKVVQEGGESQRIEQLHSKLAAQKLQRESDLEIAKLRAMISKR